MVTVVPFLSEGIRNNEEGKEVVCVSIYDILRHIKNQFLLLYFVM